MKHKISPQMVIGVSLSLIGILLILDNTGIAHTKSILRLWPVTLVGFGLIKLRYARHTGNILVSIALIFFGVMLTLDRLDVLSFRWTQWWPVVLIAAGILIVLRQRWDHAPSVSGDSLNMNAIFGGQQHRFQTSRFQGGKVTAVMGGCDIDLRHSQMDPGDAVVDLFALWGGVSMKIPTDWTIVVESTAIIGGIDNSTTPPPIDTKRLIIRGTIIMGGVELKN